MRRARASGRSSRRTPTVTGSSARSARSTLPTGFALLELDDAVRLREAGVVKPILLLEGVFEPDDLQIVGEHGLAIVVHDDEQIAMLEAVRLPARVPVYLKMNSGMNRLGFAPERYRQVFERLARSTPARGHHADDAISRTPTTRRGVAEQLRRFEAAVGRDRRASRASRTPPRSLRYPATHSDWVRPGIMLYGCSPFADESAAALGLQPAMTLSAELIAVRDAAAWRRASATAATFVADRPMRHRRGRLRLRRRLSAPRADRHAGARGRRPHPDRRPRLDGHAHRRPRSGARRARRHSRSMLWGEGLPCDEVAAAAGTVSYELLCATRGARAGRSSAAERWRPEPKTIYACTECGGQATKWQGQCPHCGAWNTLVEAVAERAGQQPLRRRGESRRR